MWFLRDSRVHDITFKKSKYTVMKSRWLAKSTIKATLSKYAQRNLIFRKKKMACGGTVVYVVTKSFSVISYP